jgi:LPS sulfotransferase NodH
MGASVKPYLSCLVTTTPRSGSWLLADGLHETGQVGQPEEYFRSIGAWIYRQEWGLPLNARATKVVTKAVESGTGDNGVFSAKLHWSDWRWLTTQLRGSARANAGLPDVELVRRYLPEPRIVYLWRRDGARQAISYMKARTTRVWNVRVGEERKEAVDEIVDLDYGGVRYWENLFAEHNRIWRRIWQRGELPVFEVVYEDFVEDYPGTLTRILEFLELDVPDHVADLQPGLVKQSDERSDRWLANYLAVRDTVTPTPPSETE